MLLRPNEDINEDSNSETEGGAKRRLVGASAASSRTNAIQHAKGFTLSQLRKGFGVN